MQTLNAIKRLEKAGYKVTKNLSHYTAKKDNDVITFFSQRDGVHFFTYEGPGGDTHFPTLKGAMGQY